MVKLFQKFSSQTQPDWVFSDAQMAEYDQHYNVDLYTMQAAAVDAILPDAQQITVYTETQRIAELKRCLKNNGLTCFLPDPLLSWLQYFGIARDAYLATFETETRRWPQRQAAELGSASVAMHRSFLQQQSEDSGRSAPMFRLHPPSPLAHDAEQGLLKHVNPFVTTRKGWKIVQEDSCVVTVEDNECLQQDKLQSRKLEAERLQRNQDDLAEKEHQFIAARNTVAQRKRQAELEEAESKCKAEELQKMRNDLQRWIDEQN